MISHPFTRRTLVASQPFYFPWVGFLSQIQLSNAFITVSDFQFVRSGFVHRVQIKIPGGTHLLTIPVRNNRARVPIDSVLIDDTKPWRTNHLRSLELYYARAPYRDEMLELATGVLAEPTESLAVLVEASMLALINYFGLSEGRDFYRNSILRVGGRKSERVLGLVRAVGADRYVTGHGAANYLDHELFERNQIEVDYVDYRIPPWPQLHGDFTPYVSALDLVANVGRAGRDWIKCGTVPWRTFLQQRATEGDFAAAVPTTEPQAPEDEP